MKRKKYLVCPLNWGLGHASRMIPIIYRLIKDENEVILGGDGKALALLKHEFPQLESIKIKDINIQFNLPWMLLNLLILIPKLIWNTLLEHFLVKKFIKENSIDVIISDNRYGLWNKNVYSIFVTHQLMLKAPISFKFTENFTHQIIRKATKFFDTCWIPDYAEREKTLCGDLSRKYPLPQNATFIGPLSRFSCIEEKVMPNTFQVITVLSGPEPSRSLLENKLTDLLLTSKLTSLIIQGFPDTKIKYRTNKNLTFVSHLPTNELKYFLTKANYIICRSGYSSIMDLEHLKLNAILIPTPGQTEQEYLAKHLYKRFKIIKQSELNQQNLDEMLK